MEHMFQKWNKLEIVLELLKQSVHLRKLVELTNIPLATLSREIEQMIQENVLDYQFAGRNKSIKIKNTLAAREYVYLAEHYKLLKLIEKYPNLSIIIPEILSKNKAPLMVIFGSYARFNAGKESDIDIYIETKDSKIKKNIEAINSRLSVKFGKFNLDSLLIKEIVKNHIIIVGVERFYEKYSFFA